MRHGASRRFASRKRGLDMMIPKDIDIDITTREGMRELVRNAPGFDSLGRPIYTREQRAMDKYELQERRKLAQALYL